jgi:DNA-directed RNA polymerase subunit RPC12/RpoP
MKVFLSWSGERSQAIAEALRDWLPKVIQAVQPWMSTVDIDRGARWSSDISVELGETSFGILCLTPENLESSWIHFEAGALSKTLEKASVCPYLYDLQPSDLKGPLVQFNATKANKEETQKLIRTINASLTEPLSIDVVDESCELWWPKLESSLNSIPEPEVVGKKKRPEREILEEILELIRQQARGAYNSIHGPRPVFKGNYVCAKCGKSITELPFQPDPNRLDGLKCRDCHVQERSAFSQ